MYVGGGGCGVLVDVKLPRGTIKGQGGFWLNQPSGILTEGRPG